MGCAVKMSSNQHIGPVSPGSAIVLVLSAIVGGLAGVSVGYPAGLAFGPAIGIVSGIAGGLTAVITTANRLRKLIAA